MSSNHLILCCPLLLLSSIFPSIRAFSNVSALHIRWQKYWSFSFSPSNEYSGLISFRIDWFDLLTVGINRAQTSTYYRVKPNKPGFPSFLSCGLQCISSRTCWTRIASLWCPEKANMLAFSLRFSNLAISPRLKNPLSLASPSLSLLSYTLSDPLPWQPSAFNGLNCPSLP